MEIQQTRASRDVIEGFEACNLIAENIGWVLQKLEPTFSVSVSLTLLLSADLRLSEMRRVIF
ncbi:hypothetical protein BVC80_7675g4 [Macleaya cordata]|uniref:Uncharacterized protein n=1 Tax=Macleaya cordata TaxID=56857 RepID=A0A200R9H1_MACCD|nr:hypothetical protein BVC80_7675g4 [Macleaya cordata]